MVCTASSLSWGAVNVKSSGVKKAAPVAVKQADKLESATSLLPTVMGLVGTVTELKKQQQQLGSDCKPTGSEIEAVNDLVKEWAKTGTVTAKEAVSNLGDPCSNDENSNNDGYYRLYMETHPDKGSTCYESFTVEADKDTVWYKFPKASSTSICDVVNTKDCRDVYNIYDVLDKIPFDKEDYTKSEVEKITKLLEKREKCSEGKIKAAKQELYGNFVTQALGSVGQSTGAAGTAGVLEAVSALGGSGNLKSMLPSLGQMATQVLEK